MLFRPEEHADNPPESWVAVKVKDHLWHLKTKDGGTLAYGLKRKRDAEALRETGFYVDLYRKEGRWYAGEHVHGWKPSPYAQTA